MSQDEKETKETRKSARDETKMRPDPVTNSSELGHLRMSDARADLKKKVSISTRPERRHNTNVAVRCMLPYFFILILDMCRQVKKTKLVESSLSCVDWIQVAFHEYNAVSFLLNIMARAAADYAYQPRREDFETVLGPMMNADGEIVMSKKMREILRENRPYMVQNDLSRPDAFITMPLVPDMDSHIKGKFPGTVHCPMECVNGMVDSQYLVGNALIHFYRKINGDEDDTKFQSRTRFGADSKAKNHSTSAKFPKFEDRARFYDQNAPLLFPSYYGEKFVFDNMIALLKHNVEFKELELKAVSRMNQALQETAEELDFPTITAQLRMSHYVAPNSTYFGTSQHANADRAKYEAMVKKSKSAWKDARNANTDRYVTVRITDLLEEARSPIKGENPIHLFYTRQIRNGKMTVPYTMFTKAFEPTDQTKKEKDPLLQSSPASNSRTKDATVARFITNCKVRQDNILGAYAGTNFEDDPTIKIWVANPVSSTSTNALTDDQLEEVYKFGLNLKDGVMPPNAQAGIPQPDDLIGVRIENVFREDHTIIEEIEIDGEPLIRSGPLSVGKKAFFQGCNTSNTNVIDGLFTEKCLFMRAGAHYMHMKTIAEIAFKEQSDCFSTMNSFTLMGFHFKKLEITPDADEGIYFHNLNISQYFA